MIKEFIQWFVGTNETSAEAGASLIFFFMCVITLGILVSVLVKIGIKFFGIKI